MERKRIANHGGGQDTKTAKRGFTRGPNVQPGHPPGSPPPDGGRLKHRRQSDGGTEPPSEQEKGRPRDTGRSGA
ncbi:MAG TPA: hypothetical protein VHM01_02520 [Alphaproteobacteria bacterium]|nr:hypothetical protein [Alphaproteobacteria bacterium]